MLTWSFLQDGDDTSGYTLIRADVMRSTDVTDVSEAAAAAAVSITAAAAAAAARHARCSLPVNRFPDDVPVLTPVLSYLACDGGGPPPPIAAIPTCFSMNGSCVNKVERLSSIRERWTANTITYGDGWDVDGLCFSSTNGLRDGDVFPHVTLRVLLAIAKRANTFRVSRSNIKPAIIQSTHILSVIRINRNDTDHTELLRWTRVAERVM